MEIPAAADLRAILDLGYGTTRIPSCCCLASAGRAAALSVAAGLDWQSIADVTGHQTMEMVRIYSESVDESR